MTIEHRASDIDALVREENLSAGIEPDIIAEAALTTTFAEILRTTGETATLALLDRVREKILAGEFEPARTRH